jgi:hypothetical protein
VSRQNTALAGILRQSKAADISATAARTSGFSATIQRFPDAHLTVILLTNTDEMVAAGLARQVAMFYLNQEK